MTYYVVKKTNGTGRDGGTVKTGRGRERADEVILIMDDKYYEKRSQQDPYHIYEIIKKFRFRYEADEWAWKIYPAWKLF